MIVSLESKHVEALISLKEEVSKITIDVKESVGRNAVLTIKDTYGNVMSINENNDISFVDIYEAVEYMKSGPFFNVRRMGNSIIFQVQFDNVPPYQQSIRIAEEQYPDFLSSLFFIRDTLNRKVQV